MPDASHGASHWGDATARSESSKDPSSTYRASLQARTPCGPWASTLHEAESLGGRRGLVMGVRDLVGDGDQQPRGPGRVTPVGQHPALPHQPAIAVGDQVGHRVEQRVAGKRAGPPSAWLGAGRFLVERHPLLPGEHGSGGRCRPGGPGRGWRRGRARSRSGGLAFGYPAAENLKAARKARESSAAAGGGRVPRSSARHSSRSARRRCRRARPFPR
jgi:hypothetical protein